MITSTEINDISAALAAAQGELEPAPFDKVNPHFKSKYASLSSCRESSKRILAKNGLAVVQFPLVQDGRVGVVTRLIHKSGQFFEDTCWCQPKSLNPQDVGSAITYLKRYGYSAAIGQASDEDDDGNASQGLHAQDANDRLKASQSPQPQRESSQSKQTEESAPNADYVIQFGKSPEQGGQKGKRLAEIEIDKHIKKVHWFIENESKTGKTTDGVAKEYLDKVIPYIKFFRPNADLPF